MDSKVPDLGGETQQWEPCSQLQKYQAARMSRQIAVE